MPQTFPACQFLISAGSPQQFPRDGKPEVAFAGRSNAGKSSALNALTGRRQLAHISKTPGRTRLINFFDVDNRARLVDLPGYGYANVPDKVRGHWRTLIEGYFTERHNLRCIVLIMDVRRPLTAFDTQMLDWSKLLGLPCHCVLTKADKLGHGKGAAALSAARRTLARQDPPVASVQLLSASHGRGVEELREHVLARLTSDDDTPTTS